MNASTRCGFIAIVGKANVGKSTLFNTLLKKQLSITTHKPQTTRHNIRGVLTERECQLILTDTPGIQLNNKRLINKVLISNAISSLQEVDIILMLVELDQWNEEDDYLLKQIKSLNSPVILVINKIDKLNDKSKLLPIIESTKNLHDFKSVIPLSAKFDSNANELITELCKLCPESEFLFPIEFQWDRDDAFVISEIVRASAIMKLQKELPYAIYTEVESIDFTDTIAHISVIIWVEKDSQKPIVIGKQGSKLKEIGELARIRLEKIFAQKIMLKTWVKVKQNWQDQQDIIAQFEN